MKKNIAIIFTILCLAQLNSCAQNKKGQALETGTKQAKPYQIMKSEKEWREELSPEAYRVLREKGTERAFTGRYWNNHEKGVYHCAGCHQELFDSSTKFESGTGWPSFYQPVDEGKVTVHRDTSYGMVREEVVCSRCGGHLGHVFPDGPKPTGLRYCMNSASLDFEKGEEK